MGLSPREQAILDRIIQAADAKGLLQKDLCQAVGIGSQAFTHWKNGRNTSFLKKLPQIAEALDTSLEYLLYGTTITSADFGRSFPARKRSVRPIVGNVSAGKGVIAIQDIIGWQAVDDMYDNDGCFWLQVSGDSMAPKIDSGDLILIDKNARIESGNIVVALVENEGFIKKVELTDDSISLISFNPFYPPMVFTGKDAEQVYFIGKVVKQERDL